MSQMTINDIPSEDLQKIKERLAAHIQGMSADELRIAEQTHSSLAEFVAEVVYGIARLLGYIIAIPLAWAENILESVGEGLIVGYKAGYNKHRIKRRH